MGDISKDIKSSFPSNKVKAMINIIYTANWLSNKQIAYMKPFGISPQQFNVLKILKGAGTALKVQTIKDRMFDRAPNTTRLMDKLIAKDLITRVHCEHDRRVVFIEITDGGMDLIEQIALNRTVDIFDKITEDEALQLSDLLDKVR